MYQRIDCRNRHDPFVSILYVECHRCLLECTLRLGSRGFLALVRILQVTILIQNGRDGSSCKRVDAKVEAKAKIKELGWWNGKSSTGFCGVSVFTTIRIDAHTHTHLQNA